tara:strand:+ start:219 stop:368 length:150 start_codon:yes stop_codon:yes gene_type:complete
MKFTEKELKFFRKFLNDAWFYCDVRNKTFEERKLFNSIKTKITLEKIYD